MKEKILAIPLISQKTLTIVLSIASFLIPFSIGQPQIVVGSLVNTAIIVSAIYLPFNLALPIIILPSLAVLLRGLIFGPFTYFLVIFLPAIWVGNWLLYFVIKKRQSGESRLINLFIAALIKSLFLYSFALILFNLKIVPKLFLTAMGIVQLITALGGGLIFFILKTFSHSLEIKK